MGNHSKSGVLVIVCWLLWLESRCGNTPSCSRTCRGGQFLYFLPPCKTRQFSLLCRWSGNQLTLLSPFLSLSLPRFGAIVNKLWYQHTAENEYFDLCLPPCLNHANEVSVGFLVSECGVPAFDMRTLCSAGSAA